MSGYTSVAADEDVSEALLPRVEAAHRRSPSPQFKDFYVRRYRNWLPWAVHAVLLSGSLILLFVARKTEDSECTRKLSTQSPALEAVEYKDIFFDGNLDWPSKYRGPPSKAIDEAWDRIQLNSSTHLFPISIQESDLAKFGQTVRPSLAYYSAEDGGGIYATIEMGHQLHCLDALRRNTYIDHYGPLDDNFVQRPNFYRVHIDHCIEMIRQVLMCNADVGLITFDWLEGFDIPFPNFNTRHKCRDFEKIYEWYERQITPLSQPPVRVGNVVDMDPDAAGAAPLLKRKDQQL